MSDERFVAGLAALGAGGLARLRRCAGQTLAESRNVYDVFFSLVVGIPQAEQRPDTYFLVATLYALTTRGSDTRRSSSGLSLGLALRALRQEQLKATQRSDNDKISLDRRVAALLDADAEQLPFRLRQIVRLVHSREQQLDWSRLLRDLLNWDHPRRFVQPRWAREYYLGTSNEPLNSPITQKEARP